MQWEGKAESENVEDRRGMKPAVVAGGGIAILAVVIGLIFGIDPKQVQQIIGGAAPQQNGQNPGGPPVDPNDPFTKFSRVIMKTTEEVWGDVFERGQYEKPKMVIFSAAVDTGGCGQAPSAVGPFYCPADRTLYLDPTFFHELEERLGGSKADFSKAYVIAHEVGHHVQNLLGYSAKVDAARKGPTANEMSVRLELQADYLAGVWANHARRKDPRFFDNADIAQAIKTAKAIGDDVLQKRSKGWANPQSYTHGTAEQREKYFKLGLQTGDLSKLKMFFDVPYNQL